MGMFFGKDEQQRRRTHGRQAVTKDTRPMLKIPLRTCVTPGDNWQSRTRRSLEPASSGSTTNEVRGGGLVLKPRMDANTRE